MLPGQSRPRMSPLQSLPVAPGRVTAFWTHGIGYPVTALLSVALLAAIPALQLTGCAGPGYSR